MKEPVRILSDLHLGHKISRITHVEALRPLVAGAGTVIFNGDTWQELALAFLTRSTAMRDELLTLCFEENATAVFLPGNHDPGWPGPGWIALAGGKIIITHGDSLLHDGSPWKREILANPDKVASLWATQPAASHDPTARHSVAREVARGLCSVEYPTGRHFFQRAWDALQPPRRALKIIHAWFTQAAAGGSFCESYFPAAEFLIIGHFHYAGCWETHTRCIINTGSFTSPGRAYWVEWNEGLLSWGKIMESPHACTMAPALDVWRV